MNKNILRFLLSAVLLMCCTAVWAGGDWTIIEYPTCNTYGTMQNPANTSELRLVPKLAHHFGDDGKCTVCHHAAPTKYNGTPATSLVTITDENYADYGLTEKNKGCVMGWKVITTAEEFMRYINNDGESSLYINFNAFLAEDIILDETINLPSIDLNSGYVFDGTGHTISGMYRSGGYYIGLYSGNSGTIRNLGLISPKIVASGYHAGCICGSNIGVIENCFVIDGNIEGTNSYLYGIASQNSGGQIINCYAITNKGNVGRTETGTITNSYAATTGSIPDDFYASTLAALNGEKVNGMTWYQSAASYPVMMKPSIEYHPATVTCTDGGYGEYWYCTVCNKYFLDANHTQETTLEDLYSPALGHIMQHFDGAEATCVATGSIEHYHCDRCLKNFEDKDGAEEIDDVVIPINPNNHSLTLVNDKAHCDRCNHDFSNFVSIDNGKPAWLIKENDEYHLKADDGFTLQDGVNYLAPVDFIVDGTFTYSRTVSAVTAGAWQCWYEPFDLQLTKDVLTKMDVAEVAGVLIDNEGNTVVAFRKIDSGWMKANTPYVFRPKDATLTTGRLELTMVAPQLYSSAETTFYNMSTYDKFTFGGNYTSRHNDSWYTLNTSGQFQKMKEGVYLKAQRFWMIVDSREGNPYATKSGMKMMVISKGQLYTINGKIYLAQ